MLQEDGGYEVARYDKQLGASFYCARINHFSQGALGRKLNRQCAFQTKKLRMSSELEFLNATGRRLMFLVLPTSYSDGAVTSIALSLKAQGITGSLDVQRAVERGILKSAFDFQLVPVPAMSAATTSLEEGQECPFSTCTLPSAAGKEAKVALVTVDSAYVYVWFNKIMKKGTELVVLPPMFGDYPEGYATRREIAEGLNFDVVGAAGMATENSAVSTISAGAAAGVASAAETDADAKEDDA